jgi:hypothetical protein
MASESMRIYSDYTIIFSLFAGYEWFFNILMIVGKLSTFERLPTHPQKGME